MSPRPAPQPPEDDDALLARLRETFHAEADAVVPFSGRMRSIAAVHDWAARRRATRRRVLAGAATLVAVALIGGASAAVANRPARSTSVGVTAPNQSQGTFGSRVHVTPSPTKRGLPAARPVAVPAGFAPLSATFVTPDIGYTLGTAPCSGGRCLLLAGTLDGGRHWQSLGDPAPSAGASISTGSLTSMHLGVRFADQDNGWIYGYLGSTPVLWWTTDAGSSWQALAPTAMQGGGIAALEATAGRAQAVVVRAVPPGIQVASAGKASAGWKAVSGILPAGDVNAAHPDLVLQQTAGWLLEQDPTYVAGARLSPSGSWTRWSPSCASSAYRVLLAAPTPTDLFELCQAASPHGGGTVYVSGRGGQAGSWQPVGPTPGGLTPQAISANTTGSFAVAGQQGGRAVILLRDTTAWVDPAWSGRGSFSQLGFENTEQGIAVLRTATGSQMLMTTDGGFNWHTVDFQQAPAG